MPFQLTVSQTNLNASEALKRKTVVDVDGLAASIGPADSECPLPGFPDQASPPRIQQLDDGGFTLTADSLTMLGNVPCNGSPLPIRSGDVITIGEWNVQFHVKHDKVAQSWRASLLAKSSQVAIGFIILVVVAAMFWLPAFLANSPGLGKHSEYEQLSQTLDNARRKCRKMDKNDKLTPFDRLFLEQVKLELDERVQYVRRYGRRLSDEQRRNMLGQVNDLVRRIDDLEHKTMLKPLPEPKLDKAVNEILREARRRQQGK